MVKSKVWSLAAAIIFFFFHFCAKGQTDATAYEAKFQKWLGVRADSAFTYASKLLAIAQEVNDPKATREALIKQGLAYGFLNEFDSALVYYRKSLNVSLANDDSLGMGKSYLNIGVNLFYRGFLDSAAFYYEIARPIFESLDEKKYLSYSLNNLGQVYKRSGKYEQAASAYARSLAIKKQLKDTVGILNAYFNLSSLYVSTESFDTALLYSQETLKIALILQDTSEIAGAWLNIALSQKGVGNADAALRAFKAAEKFVGYPGDSEFRMELYYNLARLYRDQDNYELAQSYLDKMSVYMQSEAFLEKQMAYYQLSYELKKASGSHAEALALLEAFVQVKDKYLSQSVQQQITELERKYQSEQQELKITGLELEKKTTDLVLAKSINQRNIFILVAVIFLILAGFAGHRYREKQRTSKVLKQKNLQISEALDEREILLKEIHHRVKNNLQVISSLLKLQAGSLKDEAAVDAVMEGQNRVRSMALIHQKLYSAEDIRGVSIDTYLENLTGELLTAFGKNEVDVEIETNELKLDIDSVIPLGLILNELISNSLKYAFDKPGGRISIKMWEADEKLNVTVKDNGKGMDAATLEQSNSFGWKMIRSLSRKVKAEIDIRNDGGTEVNLYLSRYKLVV
ncbi:histidine kinase dimerization/phosphoacceptor domain -containing protein [Imperialibacter roseus]|uniref:histidine kinase n=1 Tax=Imperialibacter roseus TaxID=1324217 RepID=A0ABZ0IYB6_9BACT|nr:histidine kinase dimerization/phosphoacceptor domain -containing protein [Imperialibacter roseus]WOK09384.1 histidine kinase dimerization/phosphoacceptor domain -containing protein [Imperialibacter roseus]